MSNIQNTYNLLSMISGVPLPFGLLPRANPKLRFEHQSEEAAVAKQVAALAKRQMRALKRAKLGATNGKET